MYRKSSCLLTFFGACCWLHGANLIPGDSSFETGYGVWNCVGELVETDSPDGSCALKLSTRLTSNDSFTLKPEKPYVFSVYLKADKPGTGVMLQLYRRNWDGRNITRFVKAGPEWQRCELAVPAQKIGDYNTFWLVAAPQGKAVVYVDAAQLEEGSTASEYAGAEEVTFFCDTLSPVPGQVFLKGEAIRFSFNVYNTRKRISPAEIVLRIRDYYGKTVFNHTEKISLGPKQVLRRQLHLENPERKGFYVADAELVDAGGVKQKKQSSFCLLDPPVKRTAGKPGFFGICGGPLNRIPAVSRMGAQVQSLEFRWSYDTENGTFNPSSAASVDRVVKTLREYGMEAVLYLRRTPRWAAMKQDPLGVFPPKKEFVQRYEDFAFRVASRYRGMVRCYQMWGGEADLLAKKVENELGKDKEWFSGMVAALCAAGYRGIKRADPDAVVEMTGVSGVDCSHGSFPFLSQPLKKAKGSYDQVVVHPYCYPSHFDGDKYVQSPEENDLPGIYRAASLLAGGKKVCNGEFGYSISAAESLDSSASRRMADYLARSFLLTASSPETVRLMYYTTAQSDPYSIWNWPNPRPAVAAYSALARQLAGADSPRELSLGSLVRGASFHVPGGSVAALWIPDNKPVEYLPPSGTGVKIFDLMGNELARSGKIVLSGSPVYFRATGSQEDLEKAIRSGRLLIKPLELEIRVEDRSTVRLYPLNQLNRELDGRIELHLPGQAGGKTYTLPFRKIRPGVRENLTLHIPEGIDFSALNGKEITGKVKTPEGTFDIRRKMEFLSCPYVDTPVKIDGDLAKWETFPAMELSSVDYLFPPDAFSHGLWKNPADLSVRAWTAWDKDCFYFAARVTDDVFRNPNPASSIWAGDCIQMAFDTRNDALTRGYKKDEYEFNIAFSQKENRTVASRTWPPPAGFPKTIKAVVRRNGTHIDYEMAIPFTLLRPLKPESGKVFGFNFSVLDNDLKKVDYWMGLTYGICGGKDPSVFRKFVLTKGEQLK